MSLLPYYQSSLKELSLLQTQWSSVLNPVVANPANNGILLKSVPLVVGSNSVNHKLGRKWQGWSIVRWNGATGTVYDTADTLPDLTINLNSNAVLTVDILVF